MGYFNVLPAKTFHQKNKKANFCNIVAAKLYLWILNEGNQTIQGSRCSNTVAAFAVYRCRSNFAFSRVKTTCTGSA